MTAIDPDRRRLRLVLTVGVFSAVLLGVTAPSSRPATASWSGVEGWYDAVGPAPAVTAMVWLAALAVALWLILACVLQLVARRARGRWVRSLADRLAPAGLRGVAAASLTATLVLTTPAGAGAGDTPGTATLHPLGAEEVATTSSSVATPPDPPAEPVIPAPVLAVAPEEYTIQAGDSFWTVAADRLADEAPGVPSRTSHHEYWQRLIAANVDRLVDAGNPDLLYPGQVLVLPPLT